eukprot:TRINITY_DN1838_c0_g1_i6.p1 TRINITY_DN1838_c0_g1~~TRINITY_DN1838_c0_g1_i6.p1  ORF type:complete len:293 (+),score=23.19 TRINITY_DN1838_c0_g1_i6:378-1256(+)
MEIKHMVTLRRVFDGLMPQIPKKTIPEGETPAYTDEGSSSNDEYSVVVHENFVHLLSGILRTLKAVQSINELCGVSFDLTMVLGKNSISIIPQVPQPTDAEVPQPTDAEVPQPTDADLRKCDFSQSSMLYDWHSLLTDTATTLIEYIEASYSIPGIASSVEDILLHVVENQCFRVPRNLKKGYFISKHAKDKKKMQKAWENQKVDITFSNLDRTRFMAEYRQKVPGQIVSAAKNEASRRDFNLNPGKVLNACLKDSDKDRLIQVISSAVTGKSEMPGVATKSRHQKSSIVNK